MYKDILLPGERVDDLLCDGLKIIQHPKSYCFSIDAVLLANFVKVGEGESAIDLGTGTGVIPLLMSAKTPAKRIVGVEIVRDVAERARRSVDMNSLGHRIEILHEDIKDLPDVLGVESFSVVVTNPPHMVVGEGGISPHRDRAQARHELTINLGQIARVSSRLLKFGGEFFMVHRTRRLPEVMAELRAVALEPKLLRLVTPREDAPPNLFLIMAKKGANPGLTTLPSLAVYDDSGKYTREIYNM